MMNELLANQIGRLRIIAFIEGISFLMILFVTMPLKYMYQMPNPNKIIGLVHGLLFVLYVLATIQAKIEYNWPNRKFFLVLLASVIPFGTFWVDKKLLRD